jgi:hypothetical protein
VRDLLLAKAPSYREHPYEQFLKRQPDEPLHVFVRRVVRGAIDEFASDVSHSLNRLDPDVEVAKVFAAPLEADLLATGFRIKNGDSPDQVRLQADKSSTLKFLENVVSHTSGFAEAIARLSPTIQQTPQLHFRTVATARVLGAILKRGLDRLSPYATIDAFLSSIATPHLAAIP